MKTDEENRKGNPKREVLISLSRKAKLIKKVKSERAETPKEAIFWDSRTVNQMLMMILYKKGDAKEFNTFNQWKKLNKTVKKGSKAALVWGQPLGAQRAKEAEEKGEPVNVDEDEMKYFPICYLFSNIQVK